MDNEEIKNELNALKAQLDIQAEKISLFNNVDNSNNNQNTNNANKFINSENALPESLKLNTALDNNNFQNTNHSIKVESILPESLKMDISTMNNMNTLEPTFKNDVSSVIQNKLEDSVKYNYVENNQTPEQIKIETISENPNFQNNLIEVPKKETNIGTVVTPNATNAFEVNTLKYNMNNLAENVGSALRDLEHKTNEPPRGDKFEERITINPSNLIFEDRKVGAFSPPNWS